MQLITHLTDLINIFTFLPSKNSPGTFPRFAIPAPFRYSICKQNQSLEKVIAILQLLKISRWYFEWFEHNGKYITRNSHNGMILPASFSNFQNSQQHQINKAIIGLQKIIENISYNCPSQLHMTFCSTTREQASKQASKQTSRFIC